MWLVAYVGVFIFLRSTGWWFFELRGRDATTMLQIGIFFSAWTAAQLPAAYFAGMAIASSDFRHPLRATLWTTTVYYLVITVVRAFHWPWQAVHDLDQSVPIVAYSISILLLILFSVFVAWFMPRFHKVFQKYFVH
jgi:hypothetical protein